MEGSASGIFLSQICVMGPGNMGHKSCNPKIRDYSVPGLTWFPPPSCCPFRPGYRTTRSCRPCRTRRVRGGVHRSSGFHLAETFTDGRLRVLWKIRHVPCPHSHAPYELTHSEVFVPASGFERVLEPLLRLNRSCHPNTPVLSPVGRRAFYILVPRPRLFRT